MGNPLFSIITVTFNPGEGLARTVGSLRAQRCQDFEHIIKDAGSTDGSVQQYAQAAKGYAPIVICQPDGGIYDAMNQALDLATGDYTLFLNAGDLLHGDGVLEQVAQVARREPKHGLVYGDYYNEEFRSIVRSPERLSKRLLFRNMLCHQACFIRRSLLVGFGGFDASFRLLGDYDLLAKLLISRAISCQHIDCVISKYQGGGVTRSQEGFRTGRSEMERIRRRYFSKWELLCFGTAYAFTLPGLRSWVVRSPRCKRFWPIYVHFANTYNRVFSSRACAKPPGKCG